MQVDVDVHRVRAAVLSAHVQDLDARVRGVHHLLGDVRLDHHVAVHLCGDDLIGSACTGRNLHTMAAERSEWRRWRGGWGGGGGVVVVLVVVVVVIPLLVMLVRFRLLVVVVVVVCFEADNKI